MVFSESSEQMFMKQRNEETKFLCLIQNFLRLELAHITEHAQADVTTGSDIPLAEWVK